jgi:hypothetical protein
MDMPVSHLNMFLTSNCHVGDQIKKNEMGGHAAGMGSGVVHTGFWWGKLRVRDHFEDIGIGGRIILKWIFKRWDGEHYWIYLTQGRDG